jgi:hypothetical protein
MDNSGMLLLTLSDLTASLNARFAPEAVIPKATRQHFI